MSERIDPTTYRCLVTEVRAVPVAWMCRHAQRRFGGEVVPMNMDDDVAERVATTVSNVRRLLALWRNHWRPLELTERAWTAVHATSVFCLAVGMNLDRIEARYGRVGALRTETWPPPSGAAVFPDERPQWRHLD